MKKFVRLILILTVLVSSLSSCGYNTMVEKDEKVTELWSQVENVYQRRADLIPNLVEIVKGYAKHEKETLEGVINARAKATSTNINVDNLDASAIEKFQSAQDGLSSALSKLMVVIEKYPELKADRGFRDLQVQLEGTENRISTERKRFNEAVASYNTYIRKFPNNMFAGMYGFEKRDYFEAEERSEKAPEIKF